MCGILGYYSSGPRYPLERAIGAIQSRGPDARGLWSEGPVSIGHTRLAIIDLDNGKQPMLSDDGKVFLSFNGEIYNFREIRDELEAKGIHFKTNSDTEVLLRAYLEWGKASVLRLDGIFAFAIYDGRTGLLTLARDRCGIKPLFYQQKAGFFGFGSTLKAVTSIRGEPSSIDLFALRDYLALETVFAPDTILEDVRQLEPAQILTYEPSEERVVRETYWQPKTETFKGTFDDAIASLDPLLSQTVKQQMVSDVPIGAFLSGGIDSSLMTHYLARHASGRLKTFSVGFAEKSYDESPFALEVAKKYDTDHQLIPGPSFDASLLEQALASLDQPLADPSFPLTWFLSKVTKQKITVAISGDGGDELFGGYEKFNRLARFRPDNASRKLMRWLHAHHLLTGKLAGHFLAEEEWVFYKKVSCGQFPGNRKNFARFISAMASREVRGQPLRKWRDLVAEHGGFDSREALMRADLWTYLSDNCLVKTDRASMAWGLEVRVPLLGNTVVDFALSMGEDLHFKGNQGKQLLRHLASLHLPKRVWDRRKHGFSVPLRSYFTGAWKEFGDDLFHEAERIFPILDPKTALDCWEQSLAGRGHDRMTYSLLVLLLWARNNASAIRF